MTTTMCSPIDKLDDESRKCCMRDDEAAFRRLVKEHGRNKWTWDLHMATACDAENVARYCLQQGAKPYNHLILGSMVVNNSQRVHRQMVAHGLEINCYIEVWKDVLAGAVVIQNTSWVEFCLANGADPNRAKLDDYRSLLAEAAGNGSIEIMRLLLRHGAEYKKSGALIYAAEQGNAKSVEFLLNEGFDINEIGIVEPTDPRSLEDIGTALHKAIEFHPDLVDLLVATNMELRDGRGRTPLVLAEQLGKAEIVEKLKLLSSGGEIVVGVAAY